MSDKEVKIRFETQADTRSIKELKEEIKRLEDEVEKAAANSEKFQETAAQLGTTRARLKELTSQAVAYARGADQAKHSTRQFGAGILELSRGIEDAQYGIRGILNNIPGTITAFGGSAGLAGVVSIAAVALAVFGKNLIGVGDDAVKPKENLSSLSELLKKLNSDLDKIKNVEADFGKKDFVEAFRERKTTIDEDVAAIGRYIEAVKSAIKHEGEMAKFRFEDELNAVDAKQRSGAISGTEAEEKRSAIRVAMQRDELNRLKLLDDADAAAIKAKVAAAEKEKEAADKSLESAKQELSTREEQLAQLKRESTLRGILDNQLKILEGQAEAANNALAGKFSAGGRRLTDIPEAEIQKFQDIASGNGFFTPQQIAEANEVLAALRRYKETLDKISEVQEQIAKSAPNPVERFKTPQGKELPSLAERLQKELSEGDIEKGIAPLSKLTENVRTLGTAAESAGNQVRAAQTAFEQKQGANAQAAAQRQDLATVDSPQLHQVEEEAAKSVGELMERLLQQIPNAANDPLVQGLISQVKELQKGGIDKTEIAAAQKALFDLHGIISVDNSQRGNLYNQIGATFSGISKTIDQLITTVGQVAGMQQQQAGALSDVAGMIRATRQEMDAYFRNINH
jgi:chromosome segregation ATPase